MFEVRPVGLEALIAALIRLSLKRVDGTVTVEGEAYEATVYRVGEDLVRVDMKLNKES